MEISVDDLNEAHLRGSELAVRMRNTGFVVLLVFGIMLLVFYCSSTNRPETTRTVTTYIFTTVELPRYEICFSPEGDCEGRILYWIKRANVSVHVMVYTLTLDRVGDALVDAHKRGIDVKVILDRYNAEEGSEYNKLVKAGVPVKLHQGSGLMHNKVAVIDDSITLTGSYNWTRTAENENDENLIVIHSVDVSRTYENEFDRIWSTS